MSQSKRRFLQQLLDAGDAGLPASAVPAGCAGLLEELRTCGAAMTRPAGRGSVVNVDNASAFERFVQSRFPLGLRPPEDEVADRAAGVRLHGDAKAAKRGAFEGVFIRSAVAGIRLVSNDGVELPVSDLTTNGGGAALVLGKGREWTFQGNIAVIENAEAFWQHEQVLPNVELAIYACGRLSERVLQWLASDGMAGCRIVHWGDYDPIGCIEYLRLQARCGGRVSMHVPDCIADLLPRHGKRELILNQISELDALRRSAHTGSVAELLGLFDQHRKGLEQEALLMNLDHLHEAT